MTYQHIYQPVQSVYTHYGNAKSSLQRQICWNINREQRQAESREYTSDVHNYVTPANAGHRRPLCGGVGGGGGLRDSRQSTSRGSAGRVPGPAGRAAMPTWDSQYAGQSYLRTWSHAVQQTQCRAYSSGAYWQFEHTVQAPAD